MLEFREGETRPYPFRTGRFFSINGEWYFTTRETPAFGPFVDRQRAEQACDRFVQLKLRARRRAG